MSKTSSRPQRSKPKKVHPEFLPATYWNGLKAGIPIALGYIVVSFTFGMTAVLSGMSPIQAILMSLTNLTSAGQFAGLGLITGSSNYLELLVTVSIINIRYLLMSTALSQKLVRMSLGKRMLLSFGVTDETFSVALVEVEEITFSYFFGLITLPIFGWTLGTTLGSFMDQFLSPQMQSAASIALYCMFIALVLPPAKHHKDIRFVVILTIVIKLAFDYLPLLGQISSGYRMIFSACIASIVGAIRFREVNYES